jgi:thiol-disulfide isomerase/thioredoxin
MRSAPSFSLTLLNGKTISSSSLTNQLTLLYFWSPNSTISRLLLSELQLLSAKYRARGVAFFALDTEDNLRTVKSSPEEFAFSVSFASSTPEMLVDYQVSLLPSVMIIKSGKIIYRQLGYRKDFISQVEAALQDALLTSDASTALPNEKKRKR